jgi:hypothetical protein
MDDLAQKFEALAGNIGLLDRQAGDLPPGRARFATSPVSTGPPTVANTIGIIDVACLAAITGPAECVRMTSTLSRTGGDFGDPLVASLRTAIFDRDGATIDPAEFAQPLH